MAVDPKFILLDEPFAGVDPIAVEDIQKIVSQLKKRNIGVLITDHNVQETLSITDRTYLLFEGSILREGTAESLAADEMVRKVYLGANFELKKKNYDLLSTQNESSSQIKNNTDSAYVDQIASFGRQTLDQLDGKGDKSKVRASVVEMKSKIDDLKSYFSDKALSQKAGNIVSQLEFGEIDEYKFGLNSSKMEIALLFLPIFGWVIYFMMKARLKDCISDLHEAVSLLNKLVTELKMNTTIE